MSYSPPANEPLIPDAERRFAAAFLDALAELDLGPSRLDKIRMDLEDRHPFIRRWVTSVGVEEERLGAVRLDLAEHLAWSLCNQDLEGDIDAYFLRELAACIRMAHPAVLDWLDACRPARWAEDVRQAASLHEPPFAHDGRLLGGPTGLCSWSETCSQLDALDLALGYRHRLRFQGPFLRPHLTLWA